MVYTNFISLLFEKDTFHLSYSKYNYFISKLNIYGWRYVGCVGEEGI